MKLFLKQFFSIFSLVILSFVVFGSILIQSFFNMSLEREKDQSIKTVQMCQYSFLVSIKNLVEGNRDREAQIVKIIENINTNLVDQSLILQFYDAKGTVLYQSKTFTTTLEWEHLSEEKNGMQRVEQIGKEHYIETMVRMSGGGDTFYLEIDQNIEDIYQNRTQLYDSYLKILLLVLLSTLLLAALLSLQLTRPIKELVVAARNFARGDYSAKVAEKGDDEITELVRAFNTMAQEIEHNMEELQEAARRQEAFTSSFSHELKTPLTSIIGYAEAMQTLDLTKEEQEESLRYIYHQGKRLESLAYKMMELTGIEKQEWSFGRVSVTELTDRVVQMTEVLLKEKRLIFSLSVEEGAIWGDTELLESLLTNIIDNARKASFEKGVIEIRGRKAPKGYVLRVTDHGRGIPKEEVSHIHEAFYMVDKSRSRKEGGAGIGMTLCAKILRLHHGQWQIESEVGKGTQIMLYFPEVSHET